MSITIIAAMDKNGAIGKDGKLPWHIPSEMKHFKKYTRQKSVLMGYNTFKSLNFMPLKQRNNHIKIRSYEDYQKLGNEISMPRDRNPSFFWHGDMERFFKENFSIRQEMCVIGGASIYEQALPFADRMILSVIDIEVDGADKFFPQWSLDEWRLSESKRMANEGEPIYFIETWERRNDKARRD